MFRRIFAIARRDIKSGLRDNMILYILLAPLLIAGLLRAFIPGAGENLVSTAVVEGSPQTLVDMLEAHGSVEILADREAVLRRVRATDDVFGVMVDGEQIEIIADGQEQKGSDTMVRGILQVWQEPPSDLPLTISFSDIGWTLSPLARYGGNILLVFTSVFGGMIVMLNLVEEKQEKTLAAVNVAAISRLEYIIGKGLLGFVIPIIHAWLILLIMGYEGIQYAMVTLVILSIALISLIIGFAIGIYNDNAMSAVSSMKIGFLPIFGSMFGAIFLAEKWHPLLYWSPFYWAFRSVDAIILQEADWGNILLNSALILLITGVVYGLFSRRIRRGLA